jgi:hypothetical protein
VSSSTGLPSKLGPIAASDETWTNRPTEPAAMAASSRFLVPAALTSKNSFGERALISPATCTTASHPLTASSSEARLSTAPTASSSPRSFSKARLSLEARTRARTEWPCSENWSAT